MFDIYLSKMPLLMECCYMLETFEPIQIDSITLLCALGNSLNRDHKGRLNTCSRSSSARSQSDWKSELFPSHLVAHHSVCKILKVSQFEIFGLFF